MADVFLSYDREDAGRAERVATALKECGWSVWWDRNMRAGPSFRRVIAEELDKAKCVVVLWSNNSIDSDWVCEEADEARTRAILVPALIDKVRPPLGFRQNQTANLVGWEGDVQHPELEVLKDGIRHHVRPHSPREAADSERPAHPPQPAETTGSATEPLEISGSIFVCYRRDDTEDVAGRLHDALMSAYGPQRVFMDIHNMPVAASPEEYLAEMVSRCRVMIVLIGRRWLTIQDTRGRRRLDTEGDFVRIEVAAALKSKVTIIPVIAQNASMPYSEDLPEDIRGLVRWNGIELSATRWKTDVERLIKALDRIMKPSVAS